MEEDLAPLPPHAVVGGEGCVVKGGVPPVEVVLLERHVAVPELALRHHQVVRLVAPGTDLDLDPLDMGFVVQRTYEAVDDPEDVLQDEEGVWHITAGARVRVRLTMVAGNRRYHVALVDPLPAGLEIVNPALAVSRDLPQDPNAADYRYGWWWWGPSC